MIGHINVDMTSKETPQVYRDIYQLGLDINQLINTLIEDGVHLNYLQTELDFNQSTLFSGVHYRVSFVWQKTKKNITAYLVLITKPF